MNAIKLLLVLALLLVALVHRRHSRPQHQTSSRPTPAQAAVNKEILQNAERLTETIRKCKQTQTHDAK